jgi:hypothetical protein
VKQHRNSWTAVAIFVAIVAVVICSGCKKKTVDPFPASGQISGWQKTGQTRVFEASNLWQYIDGDAEHYIQAGVVSTSTSDYSYQSRLEAVVDVHMMGNATGAQKILETGQSKEAQSIQIGDAGVAYAQSVAFRKGPYLVRIVAYQSLPNGQQALMALARGVEANL